VSAESTTDYLTLSVIGRWRGAERSGYDLDRHLAARLAVLEVIDALRANPAWLEVLDIGSDAAALLVAAKAVSEFEWDRDTISLRSLRHAIASAEKRSGHE